MTKIQTKTLVFAILPLLVAVLIMIPRLVSPQFGLMDDGLIYVEVQKILGGDLSMTYDLQAGRFRPLYWAYFTLVYRLAGPNPVWFFVSHLIMLLILLIEIRFLMKYLHAKEWQILLTSLVFLFSIPIIENFYTLSKGDPLSLVFMLASLLCLEKFKNASHKPARYLYAALALISSLSAIWAKETAYIMVPISAVWAGFVLIQRKKYAQQIRQAYLIFFGTMAGAMAAFFLIRAALGAPPVTGGTFTERYIFTWESIISRIPRWVTLFANYYHYLAPFSTLGIIVLINKKDVHPNQKLQFFVWLIWCLAWIGVLLPWEYARAYYLLAFSLGTSILVGLLAPYIWNLIKRANKPMRWVMTLLSGISIVLFLASLTHYRTHAHTQLLFDRMNHQMLQITKDITPKDGAVFSSFETRKEYVEGIEYFLVDFYGLSEITYTHISVETLERLHWYSGGVVVMPYVNNMPRLIVRAGVDEEFVMLWNEIVLWNQGDRLTQVTQIRDDFQIFNLNLPVIFCPLIGSRGYCENPDPFFDTRVFSYGWDIYTIR